jgi:6-pyruvoyltetrahydropterin/6-carboxytetrahydropterin synthase
LEAITDAAVIQRFDHKHLNEDTREFASVGGLNPSVENIAKVVFDLLAPEIARASPDAQLRSITVWETDRTCATYPG